MSKRGKRHYLLLYARQFARQRAPTFLIGVLCAGLWWFANLIPALSSDLAQYALIAGAAAGGLFFLYSLIAPRLSYVQCYPQYLCVSAPFFRVVMSYSRIRNVRPVKFAPRKLKDSQRSLVEPFLGQTILGLDLHTYPLSERWLRFGLHRFMFSEDFTGLLFHVRDWMSLSSEIDSFRSLRKGTRVDTPSINPFSYH